MKKSIRVLKGMNQRQLAMETTGPSSQGVFRTVGDDNYVHVIMPMFVQW
jgi:DNA polymerase-3 subunit beta